jgi:hemerythrin-like domain-containing protein
MEPIGPLMWEHRLIEAMVESATGELENIHECSRIDAHIISTVVDFFRTYADRTHHGKEENILFRDLEKKELSGEHRAIMEELVEEHKRAREMVGDLEKRNEEYQRGDGAALGPVLDLLGAIVRFYPAHIEKEDKHFFHTVMDYFSKEERQRMLEEFYDFDRKMIHEKYEKVVDAMSADREPC